MSASPSSSEIYTVCWWQRADCYHPNYEYIFSTSTAALPQSVIIFLLTKWLTVQGRVGAGSRLVDAKFAG